MTCPRSQRKSVVKEDKGCKVSMGTTTEQGQSVTLRQSFAACHWAKWLFDPSQKYPAFSSVFYIYSYSLLHARIKHYLMCLQRCNKISITWTVNLHSWSTSPLLFSLKIEIRREKEKTSFETWQERQEIIPWVTGHSQHLFQLQAFHTHVSSTATLLSYSSPHD